MKSAVSEQSIESPTEQQAWALLMAACTLSNALLVGESSEASTPLQAPTIGFTYRHHEQTVDTVTGTSEHVDIWLSEQSAWRYCKQLPEETRHFLALYLPVLASPSQPDFVVAHLGQSVDARIATSNGDAFFVTGEENRKHLHRLRSLCHAVVVGAATVIADDPQLTTRAVSGNSPIRVVIDPQARVPQEAKILQDGQAPTWLLHDSRLENTLPQLPGACRRFFIHTSDGRLSPHAILDLLRGQGLRRVFVEGGGVTVSSFFNARCLHRLQLAAAPLLVGEGVPALQIPGALSMLQALRPAYQLYRMGEDVMWDFMLEDSLWNGAAKPARQQVAGGPSLARLWGAY